MKKVKITIEFCILELVKISNVNLHWQSISSLNKKKNRIWACINGRYLLY